MSLFLIRTATPQDLQGTHTVQHLLQPLRCRLHSLSLTQGRFGSHPSSGCGLHVCAVTVDSLDCSLIAAEEVDVRITEHNTVPAHIKHTHTHTQYIIFDPCKLFTLLASSGDARRRPSHSRRLVLCTTTTFSGEASPWQPSAPSSSREGAAIRPMFARRPRPSTDTWAHGPPHVYSR